MTVSTFRIQVSGLVLGLLAVGLLFTGACAPPDTRAWYKGNLHTHTTFSDGDTEPEGVIQWYRDHGYNFLAITDHNYLLDPRAYAEGGDGLSLLIPGNEISDSCEGKPLHLLALGLYDATLKPAGGEGIQETLQNNVTAIRRAGALPVLAHPNFHWAFGAREMIGDGLFERFPADEVYALHNWPGLPAGHIGLNPGPMMAAADRVEIVVRGKGGHGAHPHLTVDPVLVAGHVIAAAQSIVARNVAPLEAAVVSLCAVQAGNLNAFSVVPREARISGTVRAFQHSVQSQIEARLKELVESTARAFGATADVRYQRMYPATINHRPQYEFAAGVAEQLVGQDQVVRNMPPSMGAEDFSFMLQARPGCYARLGQGGGEGCWLHSTRYDFNDAVIPLGAGYLAALAERRLPLATGA